MVKPVVTLKNVRNHLSGRWVHDGVDLTIRPGEIIGIIGASGCGKTTLIRTILMLRAQTSGSVSVFGVDTQNASRSQLWDLRRRWGMMFQGGALFSSLTVLQNIMFPLDEFTEISEKRQAAIARLKLRLVGLEEEVGELFPSELSGGMKKRVALARAIVLDPELIFLDEPSAGLDPKSAGDLDDLILHLRDSLGLTFVIVTHDLDTLWKIPDRVIFLGEGKVLAAKPMQELVKDPHPLIQSYFSGPRGCEVQHAPKEGAT